MLETIIVLAQLVGPPPAQYDHPYRGRLTIREATPEMLQRACGGTVGPFAIIFGCAHSHTPQRCTIYLRQGMPADQRAATLRHEIGHCNCHCNWHG